jgi:hypothetical protein
MVVNIMKRATIIDKDGKRFCVNTLECGTLSAYQMGAIIDRVWGDMPCATEEGFPIVVTPLMFQGEMIDSLKIIFPKKRNK